MTTHSHEGLVAGLYRQMKDVFDGSEQAMYLYLDDVHKVCNERFADLLEYESPAAWAAVDEPFPMVFVAPKSRRTLVSAYQAAVEQFVGASIDVTWQTRSGGTVDTNMILVPVAYDGHVFALHYITPR